MLSNISKVGLKLLGFGTDYISNDLIKITKFNITKGAGKLKIAVNKIKLL